MMKKYKYGFTFVEVIVVMAVIMLISTISLASYFNFNQSRILENEKAKFLEHLELAKKKAVAVDKNGLTVGATDYSACTLIGYKITINSSQQYSLQGNVCDNSGTCPLSSGCLDISLASFDLQKAIVLSPTSGSIQFDSRTTNLTGLSSVTFTHINTNEAKTITISANGLVE